MDEAGRVPVRDTLWQRRGFRRQVSATAGTIFQDTRKPLVMWFRDVMCDEPEGWGQRTGVAAGARPGL